MASLAINPSAFDDPRLRAVEDYLRTHLADTERLSMRKAASLAHLCPEHFCRFFRERVGVRFRDWQGAYRTDHARALLLESPIPIPGVGEAVGYPIQESFTRVFERYQGVTPGRLRRFVREHPELKPAISRTARPNFVVTLTALYDVDPVTGALLGRLVRRLQELS